MLKNPEFAKSRTMNAKSVPTCQKRVKISFLRANVPTPERGAIFQIGVPTCQKACQFFNYFSKEKIFKLYLTFANFKNI